jgi:hypothetical protein
VKDRYHLHRIKARPRIPNVNLLPNGHLLVVLGDNQQVPIMALRD